MSFNPIITDLSQYTESELESRISDLQSKYFKTQNPSLRSQIANALDIYQEERYNRQAIAAQRQKEQQDGKSGLDGLINIS